MLRNGGGLAKIKRTILGDDVNASWDRQMCRPDDVLEEKVRVVVLHEGFGLEPRLNYAMGDSEHHICDSNFGKCKPISKCILLFANKSQYEQSVEVRDSCKG